MKNYKNIDERMKKELEELHSYEMPFGRFKGRKVLDLPVEYLIWFRRKGFPAGKLGKYMQIALEVKI